MGCRVHFGYPSRPVLRAPSSVLCLLSSVLCLLSSVLCSRAEIPLLAELQGSLAGTTNVQSDFIQEKRLSLLQQTVVIRGRLAVGQPDRLAWTVLDPIRYTMVIEGSTLRQWDEATGRVQVMSLGGNPVFKVVVTQLRAWFSGQFDLLTRDFDVQPGGEGEQDALAFVPRAGSFTEKVIRRVVLTFREDRRYLKEILIEERTGDSTRMTFTNTILNAVIPDSAWKVTPDER